jgi:hypothetical protein
MQQSNWRKPKSTSRCCKRCEIKTTHRNTFSYVSNGVAVSTYFLEHMLIINVSSKKPATTQTHPFFSFDFFVRGLGTLLDADFDVFTEDPA